MSDPLALPPTDADLVLVEAVGHTSVTTMMHGTLGQDRLESIAFLARDWLRRLASCRGVQSYEHGVPLGRAQEMRPSTPRLLATDWRESSVHVFIRPTRTFLSCHVCSGLLFASREIKMTTTGMTFMDLDWLNRSAEGVICIRCGYVHTFMGQGHQWVEPSVVKPEDLPTDPFAG